jgi:hypothetical protein
LALQKRRPAHFLIRSRVVLPSVGLDYQPGLMADKVGDIVSNGDLAPELEFIHLA